MAAIKGLLKSKELENALRLEIARHLKPGDLLMPEIQLAQKYEVGRITVRKAIEQLVNEGLLEREQGKGTFVIEKKKKLRLLVPRSSFKSSATIFRDAGIQAGGKKYDITLNVIPDQDLYEDPARFLSSDDIDLFYLHDGVLPYLAKNGLISNLDKDIASSGTLRKNNFEPHALKAFSWNDSLYGLPLFYSPLVLFYNKDIFDAYDLEYPRRNWNWADMLNASSAMTGTNQKVGKWKTFGLGIYPSSKNISITMVRLNGGDFYNEKGRCVLDSPEAVTAMQFCSDLANKFRVVPSVNSIDNGPSLVEMFCNKYLAMFIGFYNDYLYLKDNFAGRWGMEELPASRTKASPLSVQGWAVSSKSKAKDQAFALLEGLYKDLNNSLFRNLSARLYAYSSHFHDLPGPFSKAMEYARPVHNSEQWFPPEDFYKGFANLWLGFEKAEDVCRIFCNKINSERH